MPQVSGRTSQVLIHQPQINDDNRRNGRFSVVYIYIYICDNMPRTENYSFPSQVAFFQV